MFAASAEIPSPRQLSAALSLRGRIHALIATPEFEAKHPRDEDGQFTEGSGGGGKLPGLDDNGRFDIAALDKHIESASRSELQAILSTAEREEAALGLGEGSEAKRFELLKKAERSRKPEKIAELKAQAAEIWKEGQRRQAAGTARIKARDALKKVAAQEATTSAASRIADSAKKHGIEFGGDGSIKGGDIAAFGRDNPEFVKANYTGWEAGRPDTLRRNPGAELRAVIEAAGGQSSAEYEQQKEAEREARAKKQQESLDWVRRSREAENAKIRGEAFKQRLREAEGQAGKPQAERPREPATEAQIKALWNTMHAYARYGGTQARQTRNMQRELKAEGGMSKARASELISYMVSEMEDYL